MFALRPLTEKNCNVLSANDDERSHVSTKQRISFGILVGVLGRVLALARIGLGSARAIQNGLTIRIDLQLGDHHVAGMNAL
jgi:hypothetical protein